jgi:hypothetical protein
MIAVVAAVVRRVAVAAIVRGANYHARLVRAAYSNEGGLCALTRLAFAQSELLRA